MASRMLHGAGNSPTALVSGRRFPDGNSLPIANTRRRTLRPARPPGRKANVSLPRMGPEVRDELGLASRLIRAGRSRSRVRLTECEPSLTYCGLLATFDDRVCASISGQ